MRVNLLGGNIAALWNKKSNRKPEDIKNISSTNDLHPQSWGSVKISSLLGSTLKGVMRPEPNHLTAPVFS
jgi:hypothetical protein